MTSVTICMPCFNTEATIEESVRSVLAQTFESFQLKIIDDCSTDGTFAKLVSLVKEDSRISIFRNEKNLGLENNLTRCIDLAEGRFTAIWHADDVYESTLLAEEVDSLEKYPESVAVFSSGSQIDQQSRHAGHRYIPGEWRTKKIVRLDRLALFEITLKYGNLINCPTLLSRTDALKSSLKSFDYRTYKSAADVDSYFRLVEAGELLVLPRELFRYRLSETSFSFRERKRRTTPHDFFLVLDHQIELRKRANALTDRENRYYRFLRAKDLALRAWNWKQSKVGEDPLMAERIDWSILFRLMFVSRFHFKFAVAALSVFILRRMLP